MRMPSASILLLAGALVGAALLHVEPARAWYDGHHRGHHYGHGRRSSYRVDHHHRANRSAHRCSEVSKITVIDGRARRVVGTRCHDRYGSAYIVPGSRYVVDHR